MQRFTGFEGEVYFILGDEEYTDPMYDSCASVFGEFEGENMKGIIGVVGPKRMHYDIIAPQIKYFSSLIQEIAKSQKL